MSPFSELSKLSQGRAPRCTEDVLATRSAGPPAAGTPAVGDRASRPPRRPGQAVAALVVARSAEGQQDEAPRARGDELATHRGADADEAVGAEHLLRALDEQGQLALQYEVDVLLPTAGNLLQRTAACLPGRHDAVQQNANRAGADSWSSAGLRIPMNGSARPDCCRRMQERHGLLRGLRRTVRGVCRRSGSARWRTPKNHPAADDVRAATIQHVRHGLSRPSPLSGHRCAGRRRARWSRPG
jgi:hypothetical protein